MSKAQLVITAGDSGSSPIGANPFALILTAGRPAGSMRTPR